MRKIKRLLPILALLLAFCVLMGACGGKQEESSSSSEAPSSSSSSESSSEPEPTPTDEPEKPLPTVSDDDKKAYADAVAANEDCVAWVNIPGTEVNYPVMQSEDNSYYWEHDPNGEYLAYGSVYAHFNNDMSSVENLYRNTVLFGHNKYVPAAYPGIQQADGTPFDQHLNFSTLMNFQGINWAQDHRYITLTIGEETSYWVIFAALDTETANDQETFYYWNTCFEEDKDSFTGNFEPVWQTDADWKAILDQAMDRSYWDYNIEVDPAKDKILTLSTCSYDWGMANGITNAKFILMARQLHEDELAQGAKFIESLPELVKNEDRREPDVGRDRLFITVASGQYKPADYKDDMELPEGYTAPSLDASASSASSAASEASEASESSESKKD